MTLTQKCEKKTHTNMFTNIGQKQPVLKFMRSMD